MGIALLQVLVAASTLLMSSNFVSGHGRLRDPPSRSSLWRTPEDPAIAPYLHLVEANYNDNELFCGGSQHLANLGGLCGVCGDPYDAAIKDNEAGGRYAKGIITRQYSPGSWINVKVEITAHHKGYFEFRLCPWNNPLVPVTHACLDQYVLETDTPESPKWTLPSSGGADDWWYDVAVKLPDGIECDQCVFQWKYHTGNSWGCDAAGSCCPGCGHQEEFYGCSDIAIGSGPLVPPPDEAAPSTTTKSPPASTETSTSTPTTTTATNNPPQSSTTTPGVVNTPASGLCQEGSTGNVKKDCTSFYQCNGPEAVVFDCPPGTVFNDVTGACDHAYNVPPPCGTKT